MSNNNNRELAYYRDPLWSRFFDRFFDDAPASNALAQRPEQRFLTPSCDFEETEKAYLIAMDIPGAKKEDIKIDLQGDRLVVTGEKRDERKEESKGRRYVERYHGQFSRAFVLGPNVDSEKVEAHYDNGVLNITVPKSSGGRARQIQVRDRPKS